MALASDRDIADVMAEVARSLDEPLSLRDRLDRTVLTARETVPGVEAASITSHDRTGQFITLATTDEFALTLDQAHYELHEGPCLEAL